MWKAASHYLKMALEFPRWARTPLEPDPWATVRPMLENRANNFLGLMRQAVFDNPENPYHQLFAWAGCAYGDLERMVRKDGLEPALRSLLEAGVYLSHQEFKGIQPVRRGAKQLTVDSAKLANPDPRFQRTTYTSSSGSRSRGTTTWRSLEYHTYREAQERVMWSSNESGGREFVRVESMLPSTGGLRRSLHNGLRRLPDRWFTHSAILPYRAVTRFFVLELRAMGIPAAFPEILPPNDFRPVARYIAARKYAGGETAVYGSASTICRIAAAAVELGLDISGTLFQSGGEALTEAKRAVIEKAGAEVHSRYTISELGPVGVGCRGMPGNRLHLAMDAIAAITRRRIAPLSDVEVDSLLFTSLLPFAATILVNVEMDDAGVLGPATCNCPLAQLGFDQEIADVYSYGKLTGQGTSLMGGEILHLLESLLPAKFGGVPSDYQLVEQEGANQTELELRINPRLGVRSPEEVRDYFLSEIRGLWSGSLTESRWSSNKSVRAVVAEPYKVRNKVHTLHLLGDGHRKAAHAVAGRKEFVR